MDAAFHAIAEPNRRRILEILAEADELSSGAIASRFRQTAAAVSQHLGVLEDARLVTVRRDGVRRLYRLRADGFAELHSYLERFWALGLTRLKAAVEAEAARSTAHGTRTRRPDHAARPERRRRRR